MDRSSTGLTSPLNPESRPVSLGGRDNTIIIDPHSPNDKIPPQKPDKILN